MISDQYSVSSVQCSARLLITTLCALITSCVSVFADTAVPFYDDFSYSDGASLDGVNGWEIFTTGPGVGNLPDRYHGFLAVPGGTATATNDTGRVAGVSLQNTFGDYTGEPGTGWPSTTGKFDKPAFAVVRYELDPGSAAAHIPVYSETSKFGTMYTTSPRWHYEGYGAYYKMLTVVRYFMKTNGLISAYNGHRIQHLSHSPITNRTQLTVVADYSNHVWSLTVGSEMVVSNFTLYKSHQGGSDPTDVSPMLHDGWYKDYDGLKKVGFVEHSADSVATVDEVRVFEGRVNDRSLPFIETFETRTIAGKTITMSVGDLNGQNAWFASDADIATAAQSDELYSVGSNGVVVSGGGECFQLFLDEQTNVWTDLWVKPAASGSGDTTVDAGGEDAVFTIDSTGDVYAYDGGSASVVTSVVPTAWSRFTVNTDYGNATWDLLLNGSPVASGLGFKQVDAGDYYEELRVSASGTAQAHVDDISVSLDTPFNLPTVSFQTDMAAVGENMTNVTVTAVLSHAYISAIVVDYVLRAGGSASAVDDYSMSDGTLVFAPGETEKSFSFVIVDDADNEEDETLFFALTNIVNATAGTYLDVTYTIESDPADWYNIPFYEPFEDRDSGDLAGQRGWTATHVTVQTNDTHGGSAKAAQGLRIASEHAHTFSNGAIRVVTDWRAKAVFSENAAAPPAGSSFGFYVSTNGHVIAFDGVSAVDQGTNVVLVAGQWAHFVVSTDHAAKTWDLEVDGVSLATGLGFYSTGSASYGEFGVDGPVTIDEVTISFDAPAPPTNLTAVALDSEVVLDWDVAQGAWTYNIKRATTPGGPYTTLGVTNVTTFRDLTPVNDTTYYYVFSSVNGQGEGSDSLELSATPRAAVQGLASASGIGIVNLQWDAFAGATNYLVKRAGSSGGPYTLIASATTTNYADSAVANGQTYYYVVAAQTLAYVSTDSDEASGVPALRTIFYDSFEAPAMSGRLEMDIPGWKRTNTSGNPDTRAGLWNEDSTSMDTPYGSQAAWVWSDRQITTTNIWEELQGGAIYTLSFNAASEFGLGGIDYDAELLAGTNVLGAVSATWPIDTHEFQYRFDDVVFAAPTNHFAIGLPLGVRLRFGSGDWHYVIGYDNVRLAVNVPAPPVLPDPMSFAVVPASHSSTSIVMSATTATNGVRLLTYQFTNTLNGATSGWMADTNWIDVGLFPGTLYGYRVKARDVYGNETDWSPVASASPIDLEAPVPEPAGFAIAPAPSGNGEISMTAVTATDISAPVQYRFANTTNGNDSGWTTNSVWTDSGLTVGQSYGYRVQTRDAAPAVNSNSWSGVSSTVAAGVPIAGLGGGAVTFLPDAATLRGELAAGGAATATLCWGTTDAGAGSPGDWPHGVPVGSVLQSDVFFSVITGLTHSTTYAYRCYVTNAVGESWSVATNFTTTGNRNVMVSDAGSRNSWNTIGNWTYGHTPTGTEAAAVNDGVAAKVDSNSTPTFSGGLTLGSGASLQVGWTTSHAANKNALGSGTLTMHDGSSIISRAGLGTYVFTQPLVLAGDATIWAGISTANGNTTKTFSGGVSGPGQLTYNGVNGTWFVFDTANPVWTGGFQSADPQNQRHRVRADINGAFGAGDVALNNNCSLQVQAGVIDAIDDGATVSLNGVPSSDAGSKLVMNGSDTIYRLFIDGVQQPGGTYTSADSFITGSGTLTVLDWPAGITNNDAFNVTTTTASLISTLDAPNEIFDVHAYWSTNNNADASAWLADVSASNAAVGTYSNVVSITNAVASLTPARVYYYTMRASNAFEVIWASPSALFVVPGPPTVPTVTTNSGATAIGIGTATLNGLLIDGGSTAAFICWGDEDGGTSTGAWDHVTAAMSAVEGVPFSSDVTALLYGLPYSYRVYVTNSAGTAWSGAASFTTLAPEGEPVLPVSGNLVAHYDAGAGVATNGSGVVQTWADQSGNGHDATFQSGTPTLVGNALNARPEVQCRNRNSYLNVNHNIFVKEQYVVGRADTATWNNYGAYFANKSGRAGSYLFQNGNTGFHNNQYPQAVTRDGVVKSVSSSGTLSPMQDYMILKIVVNAGNTTPRQYYLGRSDHSIADLDVLEIIGYSTTNTLPDENQIGGYLEYKYGIGTSYSGYVPPSAFSITNTLAAHITQTTADLQGLLDATQSVFAVHAYISTNNNTGAAAWLADGDASVIAVGSFTNVNGQSVVAPVSGLTGATTYYYTMAASNVATEIWATPNASFDTQSPPTTPVVTTGGGATHLGVGTAALRGLLTTGVFADATLCWGESDGGTNSTADWANVASIGILLDGAPFTNAIAGLYYGIEYDYRVYVTNVAGDDWSELATFKTAVPLDPTGGGTGRVAYAGMTITSSSDFNGRDDDDAFNGNGLSGDTHNNSANDMWLTDTGDGVANSWLKIGLGAAYTLDYLRIWNYNETANATTRKRGISQCDIYIADSDPGNNVNGSKADFDASGWTLLKEDANFANADQLSSVTNSDPHFGLDGADAAYLAIRIDSHHGGDGYVGLSEMHIHWASSAPTVGIANTAAANVGDATADLAGVLDATGSVFTVTAFWSTNNNADGAAWLADGSASSQLAGTFTNVLGQPVVAAASSLSPLTTYYYTMRAYNAATNLWATPNVSFSTLSSLLVAINDTPATDIDSDSAVLNGTLQLINTNADVYVYWGPADGGADASAWPSNALVGSWTNAISTNVSYTTMGLNSGQSYYYAFQATNAATNVWSSPSVSLVTDLGPADVPVFTNTASSWASVTLGWSDNTDAETGYILQRSSTGAGGPYTWVATLAANTTVYIDASVSSSRAYVYQLAATNATTGSTTAFAAAQTSVSTDLKPLTALGVLDLTANGAINPATGEIWAVGDTYRFIFASSVGTNALATDINVYNAFVQSLADASGLGIGTAEGATWKAIASTATVAAKDNTSTASGTGESIWLVTGTTLVADDYADFYASASHSSAINKSETGGAPYDGGDFTSNWTGSDGGGNIKANDELGDPDGSSHTGLWGHTSNRHWIDRFSIDNTKIKGFYGLSDPLTLRGLVTLGNLAASDIASGSATLNANLQVPTTNASVWVYWGTTDATNTAAAWTANAFVGSWDSVNSTNISFEAGGLSAAQQYYYTFYASNEIAQVWAGPSSTFTTFAALAASVDTLAASAISSSAATLNGDVTVINTNVDVYVYWGTTDGASTPGAWDTNALVANLANVVSSNVSHTLTGLSSEQDYYYRFFVINPVTNAWGAPSVTFQTHLGVAQTPAFTNTSATWAWVDLGWADNASTETAYILKRSASGAGGPYSVLATLAANTVGYRDTTAASSTNYHYRLAATNAGNGSVTLFASAQTAAATGLKPVTALGLLDLTANGAINPATGQIWAEGDTYRFIFASSVGTNATSADIGDYNAFVQALANASGLGVGAGDGATWKAVASTAAVAARDNTSTASGTGESIWLLNGTTLVADDYADFYGSASHSSAINRSETGGAPYDGGDFTSNWTGSDGAGHIKANDELGDPDGTSHTGLWGHTSVTHWIDRFSINNTLIKGVYGLSDPLTLGGAGPSNATVFRFR